MAKDDAVRFNRLSLLEEISGTFHMIADFSKIVTATANYSPAEVFVTFVT